MPFYLSASLPQSSRMQIGCDRAIVKPIRQAERNGSAKINGRIGWISVIEICDIWDCMSHCLHLCPLRTCRNTWYKSPYHKMTARNKPEIRYTVQCRFTYPQMLERWSALTDYFTFQTKSFWSLCVHTFVQMHMHNLGHAHIFTAVWRYARVRGFKIQFPVTFTCCLLQSYTAVPPFSAPRCTEAESRMEQNCVWWQWHPSHAMNNQWTPSGAYNRGAQLQSFWL